MSQEFKGFIVKLTKKDSPPGAKRRWTLYSVKLEKRDGTEYDDWLSLGFDDPGVKEGDYIVVQADQENGRWRADIKTLQKSKNPPARANKGSSGSSAPQSGESGAGGSEAAPSSSYGGGFNRQTNPEDAKRITYQASRGQALELVRLLIEVKGLPFTKADTKAGEAKRFDEIKSAVDKLTVEFYNDALSLRKLETVADTVPDKAADGPLPDTASEAAPDAAEPDDSPDEDDEGFEK